MSCLTLRSSVPLRSPLVLVTKRKHHLQLSMEALKPGLHWDAVQLLCHRTLIRGFQRLGIFKTPTSPGSGSWNSEEAILASGVSAAFFPHGLGHSLGLDVHDVPSASKPDVNPTIKGPVLGHESFYTYLRLRLPLEEGMVVVSCIHVWAWSPGEWRGG